MRGARIELPTVGQIVQMPGKFPFPAASAADRNLQAVAPCPSNRTHFQKKAHRSLVVATMAGRLVAKEKRQEGRDTGHDADCAIENEEQESLFLAWVKGKWKASGRRRGQPKCTCSLRLNKHQRTDTPPPTPSGSQIIRDVGPALGPKVKEDYKNAGASEEEQEDEEDEDKDEYDNVEEKDDEEGVEEEEGEAEDEEESPVNETSVIVGRLLGKADPYHQLVNAHLMCLLQMKP